MINNEVERDLVYGFGVLKVSLSCVTIRVGLKVGHDEGMGVDAENHVLRRRYRCMASGDL